MEKQVLAMLAAAIIIIIVLGFVAYKAFVEINFNLLSSTKKTTDFGFRDGIVTFEERRYTTKNGPYEVLIYDTRSKTNLNSAFSYINNSYISGLPLSATEKNTGLPKITLNNQQIYGGPSYDKTLYFMLWGSNNSLIMIRNADREAGRNVSETGINEIKELGKIIIIQYPATT